MKTLSEAEDIVGRKLNKSEMMIYQTFKLNDKYQFQKDENGFLKAVKK